MSHGLCEGQETATYTQPFTHKVKLKRAQNRVFDSANSMNPVAINFLKTLNFVFCSVVFMNESSVCAGQMGEVLW